VGHARAARRRGDAARRALPPAAGGRGPGSARWCGARAASVRRRGAREPARGRRADHCRWRGESGGARRDHGCPPRGARLHLARAPPRRATAADAQPRRWQRARRGTARCGLAEPRRQASRDRRRRGADPSLSAGARRDCRKGRGRAHGEGRPGADRGHCAGQGGPAGRGCRGR
jgi:hypothetical protein